MNRALEHARAASIVLAEHRARKYALDGLIKLAERRVAEGWAALDVHLKAQRPCVLLSGPSRIAPVRVDPPVLPISASEGVDSFMAAIASRLHRA